MNFSIYMPRFQTTWALVNRILRRLSHRQVINNHWHLLTLLDLSGCNECQCYCCTHVAAASLHWQKVSAHVVLIMIAPRNAVFVREGSLTRERISIYSYKCMSCLLSGASEQYIRPTKAHLYRIPSSLLLPPLWLRKRSHRLPVSTAKT